MSELELRRFSSSIVKFVNESPLPMEFKRLALKDITRQIEDETEKKLQVELVEEQAQAKEEEDGTN